MTADSFSFESPDECFPGALGEPGDRVFFIQVVEGSRTVILKAEKEHVKVLGHYLKQVGTVLTGSSDTTTPKAAQPLIAEWAIGSVAVDRREGEDRVLIVFEQIHDPDDSDMPATARVWLNGRQATRFAIWATLLCEQGRELCEWCLKPKEPLDHACAALS